MLYLASASVYLLTFAYFRFWASRKGTPYCHERSILYRSPQMPWALACVTLIGWFLHYRQGITASLPVAYPIMGVYYGLRFGALRRSLMAFYLLICFFAIYLSHQSVLDVLRGSALAITVVFSIDLIWNWKLKKAGIVVPGPDPDVLT